MQWIMVFMGGGLGSVVRFMLSKAIVSSKYPLPLATLTSNLLASFILGLSVVLIGNKVISHHNFVLLGAGFCGGFSTFSTFSYETLRLWQQGEMLWAITNIFVSVLGSIFVVYLGMKFLR